MKLRLPYNYEPRSYQIPFLSAMDNGKKRAVLVWHRRAGKDKTLLNFTIKEMFKRVGVYYYLFPTYAQGKKILWDGVDGSGMKFLSHIPKQLIVGKPNNTEMKVKCTNGSVLQVVGTDNYDSIMGTNPVGCVFSEYALQDPRAWDLIRPILRENGGWAIFNYTPRGDNHGKTLYEMAKDNPEWFCQLLTIRDTAREDGSPIITAEDIEAERAEGMDEDLIQQEYFCSFSGSVQGAYFFKQIQKAEEDGRITSVPHDERLPVETWWDLGMDDSMTIWFTQTVGREVRVIDYIEDNGEGLMYYAKLLKERDYLYGDHHLPHDVEVRELGTGTSRKDTAESLGIKPVKVIPRVHQKEDAIDAARSFISRCWFDKVKCKDGLSALKNYSKDYDEKKKVFRKTPRHDWASHGADAFMTLAMGYTERIDAFKPTPPQGYAVAGGWMV